MTSLPELELPICRELAGGGRVLVAGAGGGFDVFSGLPVYFSLREAGKEVFLASLSFSSLTRSVGAWLSEACVEVTADSEGYKYYFPEQELAAWFREQGEEVAIYCFYRTGVQPLLEAYRKLVRHLDLDTVVLVDGGTDSLMRGDETGLGTPEEDMASVAAVSRLDLPRKLLVCLGFGVDWYHGVCHAQFLEAVAELTRTGGFLGGFSLVREMPAVQRYLEAATAVRRRMREDVASIVCNSIVSALEGRFGDYHATQRTAGSKLWINPLMTWYWCFRVDAVADRLLYLDRILDTNTYEELRFAIHKFRSSLPGTRPWDDIPL